MSNGSSRGPSVVLPQAIEHFSFVDDNIIGTLPPPEPPPFEGRPPANTTTRYVQSSTTMKLLVQPDATTKKFRQRMGNNYEMGYQYTMGYALEQWGKDMDVWGMILKIGGKYAATLQTLSRYRGMTNDTPLMSARHA